MTCFALVAWGQDAVQTLVGLPELGITLKGTPQEPTVVNNSGRIIIGYVLHLGYASGGGQDRRNLKTRGLRLNNVPALGLSRPLDAGIPPGGTESPLSHSPGSAALVDTYPPPPPFVKAVLDAVVFADGEFVGPDTGHNFEVLANQLIAEQELALRVSAARSDPTKRESAWAEVALIAHPQRPLPHVPGQELAEMGQRVLASDLMFAKNRAGEAAGYDVADREMAIPKLWRAQQ